MNKEQLKELVKAHFNLIESPESTTEVVEESFGEMEDENKAFKIKYDGELKVGTSVYVETEEGQKAKAPDGYHKLANGTVIKTENGEVVEIEKEEEEMAKEEMSAETTEVVETTEDPGDEQPEKEEEVKEAEIDMSTAEIVEELANAFKAEIAKVSNELAELKEKFSKISAEPASERTLPSVNKEESTLVDDAPNADRIKMALEMIKNKKK